MTTEFTEQNLVQYLKKHPDFLINYATELGISLNENTKIRSFVEAQLIANKDIIENLEMQLNEMYQIAEDNFELIKKIMTFNKLLLACTTIKQVFKTVSQNLDHLFGLKYSALKLIIKPKKKINLSTQELVTDNHLIKIIEKNDKTMTGNQCIHPSLYTWFHHEDTLESFLYLPLKTHDRYLGLLLIGHTDPQYFAENVPTDYVQMLAESIAICLNRIIGKK